MAAAEAAAEAAVAAEAVVAAAGTASRRTRSPKPSPSESSLVSRWDPSGQLSDSSNTVSASESMSAGMKANSPARRQLPGRLSVKFSWLVAPAASVIDICTAVGPESSGKAPTSK